MNPVLILGLLSAAVLAGGPLAPACVGAAVCLAGWELGGWFGRALNRKAGV